METLEDTEKSVADQSNTPNNKGPTKKFVQQAFHPSLFKNSKSKPQIADQPAEKPQTSESENSPIEVTQHLPSPYEWQTVPTLRQYKRRRVDRTPSNEPVDIPLQNQYEALQVDTDAKESTVEKLKKPPPIVLYGIQDTSKLTELIDSVLSKVDYTYRFVTKNQLRVNCTTIDAYKKLIEVVREKKLIGHTFTRKDERPYRIVIKNLHPTTPTDAIIEAVESTGNKVKGKIINARYGPNKTPLSTWFVNLEPSPNNGQIKQLKYIYHTSVTIEDPIRKREIPQCKRCQQYGHTKNNCLRPYRCVKCAESHNTIDCPKGDRSTPAKCALCLEDHPANYKGCRVFLEIQSRKFKKSATKTQEPNKQTTAKTFTKSRPTPTTIPTRAGQTENTYIPAKNEQPKTYAQAVYQNDKIEEIILKQAEKMDRLMDQMGTLIGLLTVVIQKLN